MKTSLTADICTIKNCSGRLPDRRRTVKTRNMRRLCSRKFDGRYL